MIRSGHTQHFVGKKDATISGRCYDDDDDDDDAGGGSGNDLSFSAAVVEACCLASRVAEATVFCFWRK